MKFGKVGEQLAVSQFNLKLGFQIKHRTIDF